jgi:dTDP-4-dehydrorhamnose 3,5-epimerase
MGTEDQRLALLEGVPGRVSDNAAVRHEDRKAPRGRSAPQEPPGIPNLLPPARVVRRAHGVEQRVADGRATEREPGRLFRATERTREHGRDPQPKAAHSTPDRTCVGSTLRRQIALSAAIREDNGVLIRFGEVRRRVPDREHQPAALELTRKLGIGSTGIAGYPGDRHHGGDRDTERRSKASEPVSLLHACGHAALFIQIRRMPRKVSRLEMPALSCGDGARSPCNNRRVLPDGVALHPLIAHADDRGVFTELFRGSWELGVEPVQWNAVRSEPNVLRGVHAHRRHTDYLTLVVGSATIGLHDLRPGSPTAGLGTAVELDAREPAALVIPVGVAHGFYFPEPSLHVYAVSHEFDPADELGCRWDDHNLGIAWPCTEPQLSGRDRDLGPLSQLRDVWHAAPAPA